MGNPKAACLRPQQTEGLNALAPNVSGAFRECERARKANPIPAKRTIKVSTTWQHAPGHRSNGKNNAKPSGGEIHHNSPAGNAWKGGHWLKLWEAIKRLNQAMLGQPGWLGQGLHESHQQAAMAKKTVTTGPEQGHERTRKKRGD